MPVGAAAVVGVAAVAFVACVDARGSEIVVLLHEQESTFVVKHHGRLDVLTVHLFL